MTADTASEQAASAGDVPTSQDGQLPDGVLATGSVTRPVEQAAPDTTETKPTTEPEVKPVVPETLTPKNQRKSDEDWQAAQEAAKATPTLEEKVTKLERELARERFEKDYPIAKDYKDELDAMDKDPRWAPFSWTERLQHVHKPDTSTVKADMASQAAKTEGSVMTSSRPTPAVQGVQIPESAASWFGSEKEARAAYEKYGR